MMKDMTVPDAKAIIAALDHGDLTLDQIEDFSFTVLKAIAVVRKDLEEKEKTYG